MKHESGQQEGLASLPRLRKLARRVEANQRGITRRVELAEALRE